jgi:hypothetical protein
MNYDNYYDEIIEDIRVSHGDRFISNPSKENRMSWKEAIAKYDSLTPEEHKALSAEVARLKGW